MALKNLKFKFIIVPCFLTCFFTDSTWATDEQSNKLHIMPFKLGFEFQESSSLCEWAEEDLSVQKKPLFFVTNHGYREPLWHVVIDTSDIEFVTRPFYREEGEQVEKSLQSIISSFKILHNLLLENKISTFDNWLEELLKAYNNSSFIISCSQQNYKAVGNKAIKLPDSESWKPVFSPQVTIQHPLEFTIPLYFGLFGFKSSYMIPFSASLPARDKLLEAQEDGNSQEFWKIMGGV